MHIRYTEGKALATLAADYIRRNGPNDPLVTAYFHSSSDVAASFLDVRHQFA